MKNSQEFDTLYTQFQRIFFNGKYGGLVTGITVMPEQTVTFNRPSTLPDNKVLIPEARKKLFELIDKTFKQGVTTFLVYLDDPYDRLGVEAMLLLCRKQGRSMKYIIMVPNPDYMLKLESTSFIYELPKSSRIVFCTTLDTSVLYWLRQSGKC